MTEKKPLVERLASWTRFALLAAIAVVLGLIVTAAPNGGYPQLMSRAQAEGIAAAPGFLLTSVGVSATDIFYVVDTNKQVICVYGVTNDQLRLKAARKFDIDSDIVEASAPIQVGAKTIKPEGGNGISREEAKGYVEKLKDEIDKLLKRLRK